MTYWQLLEGNRDFRRLWLGQVISEIGDWLNNITVFALTLKLAGPGREGLAVAIYAAARHLPLLIFGPIAGVVADRANRQQIMIAADYSRAVLVLGFLVANRLGSLTGIYAVGAMLFAVSTFFNAAKRAALPNIVRPHDELLTANALAASTTAATIAIGSALGGLLATFLSHNIIIVLNAATFVVSAEFVRRVQGCMQAQRLAQPVENARRRELPARRFGVLRNALDRATRDFHEGLRYVRRDRMVAAIFVVAAGWGLGNGAARALYSLFGARLGEAAALPVARPADFGISVLFVAMGVGGVIGAPVARRFNVKAGHGIEARMGRSIIFDGCGLTLFSLMPTLWSAAFVLVLREINFAIWWTAQQTILMRRVDNHFAGRVFASYDTTTTLMMVSSILASGAASDAYGMRVVAGCAGSIIMLSGVMWFVLRRSETEQLMSQA